MSGKSSQVGPSQSSPGHNQSVILNRLGSLPFIKLASFFDCVNDCVSVSAGVPRGRRVSESPVL